MNFPMQPIYLDDRNVARFRENKIVEHIRKVAAEHGCDLNHLATMDFPIEDREQFAQLMGYSVYGYGTLSYVRDTSYALAEAMAVESPPDERDAKIEFLENRLNEILRAFKQPVADLYMIHPDNLMEEKNGN